jgi:predicted Zn-dependent protease
MKTYFQDFSHLVFKTLMKGEHLFLNLAGDDTQFVRVNGARIRQIGLVENYFLEFNFVVECEGSGLKKGTGQIVLTGDLKRDTERFRSWLDRFREEFSAFPFDPYAEIPVNRVPSLITETHGQLLDREQVIDSLLVPAQGLDLAGLYSAGTLMRGMSNSAGLFHWFSTETYCFDYSLFTSKQKALKGTFSGLQWSKDGYRQSLSDSLERLARLDTPSKKLGPGNYRVYLAPAAVSDLIGMFSGGAVSELEIQKNESPLRLLRSNEKALSTKFSLIEDYSEGTSPRFNDEGEIAPLQLTLINQGKLSATLIHSRTGKEFGLQSNGANASESMMSAVVAKGDLAEEKILSRLGTGLYLSNLHYLNWSDQVNGRVTGMTRYACFWVEEGKLVCPIENLRFDDTIFDLFGNALEDFTNFDQYLPETGTYHHRGLGGMRVPGALISKMHFSL